MKKMTKKFVMLFLTVFFLFAQVINVLAEEVVQFKTENYEASQGKIKIYARRTGEYDITSDNLKVKLDGNELPITAISNLDVSQEAMTYYCLVDVSGSLDQNRINRIKEMIKQIVEQMKDQDNMCVATIADEYVESGFLSDHDALKEAIDAIEVKRQNTNLYHAINESVKTLKDGQSVHENRCLIIFSDGADVQATGLSYDEVIRNVEEARVPVYTVAMMGSNADIEPAKILGSFSRQAIAGTHTAPMLDGVAEDTIAGNILADIGSTYVIECELKDIELTKRTVELQVILQKESGTEAIDKVDVPAERIENEIEITPEPVVEPEPEPEPETVTVEPEVEEPEDSNVMLYIIIGIAVAIVVVIIIILLVASNSKKKRLEEEARRAQIEEQNRLAREQREKELAMAAKSSVSNVAPAPAPVSKKPSVVLHLYKLGNNKEEALDINVYDQVRVGRSKTKCDFCIENDQSLSSLHCTFRYADGNIYLKDEDSSNGTFVNGVPIHEEYVLNKEDIVFIGAFEYRIIW